ncbi:MAG TPA: lysozyme inhibitor LprI family protein [Caulobacteraceae bacterium]
MRVAVLIAALAALALPQSSFAATPAPSPADARTLTDCVAKAGNLETGCVGLVADACLKTADSQERMGDCETRELAIWDAWLNRDYQAEMGKLPAAAQVKLRAIERAFIADRDSRCGFYAVVNGPTYLNVLPQQTCALQATAVQWLWLKDFVTPPR